MDLPDPSPALRSKYPNRSDLALAYLKGLLLDGGLEPDQVISTEGVGRSLQVSRAPATDAIKRLARDGFIDVVPQIGCRIRAPQANEVADFYRLFSRCEALITGLAAERRTEPEAASFASLVEQLEGKLQTVLNEPNPGPTLRVMNRDRMKVVHELANSRIAGELVSNMWDRSDYYVRIAFGEFVIPDDIWGSQSRIAAAVVAGDAATAASETETYLLSVGERTSALL